MVRCASGVTTMRQRPVGTSAHDGALGKATPSAWDLVDTRSAVQAVGRHLPDVGRRPQRTATPHMVLAAEPPDISIGATMAACSVSARSASMVIEPLTSVCRWMNSS